nr:MAG TPA: hypothetical protein [Bacteriophage sp.]
MIIRCWEIKVYESCLIQISSLVPIIGKHYCISRNDLYTFFLLNKIYFAYMVFRFHYIYNKASEF